MRKKVCYRLFGMVLACLSSGCATWSQHGVRAADDQIFRIAVLPIQVTAVIDQLSGIMTPPGEVSDENALIGEQVAGVARRLGATLHTTLGEIPYFEIAPLEKIAATAESLPPAAQPWSQEDFDNAGIGRDVQAVLLVDLAGYGKMKKEWLTFLIGTGIVEGIVQGVVAARVIDNTWVGVAVALEEIAQEFLVWGGGSYLFNTYYAPVTLEARLISTSDGRLIWNDTIFVSADKKAIKALPEEDQNKREFQLELTGRKAIGELVDALTEAAKRNAASAAGAKRKRGGMQKSDRAGAATLSMLATLHGGGGRD